MPPTLVPRRASVRSHCPYCAFQCGLVATVEEGSVEVRPDEGFAVNRGQMCIKGMTAGDLLDHPDRLRTPLVRSRGQLVEASWDAALDELAARLDAIRERHGADANGVFGSGALTNEKAYLLGKFARVALGTANIDYNGRYCMSSAAAGQRRVFGIDRGLPFPVDDIARSEVVVLWGSNCADTMPPIMQWFEEQQSGGGTFCVVDPRRSATAARADLHLQLTPGSDLALALGLLHVVVVDGLADGEYLDHRTTGWDKVRRGVLAYDPARVERITGVPATQIRQTAHLLAEARSAMLLSGRGPEQQASGSDTVVAFANLMLALGHVGRPASGYGCLTGQGNGQGGRELGQKADQLPGYRSIVDDLDRAVVARVWGVEPDGLPGPGLSAYEMVDAFGAPGGIHGLLVVGSNLAVASPDRNRTEAALGRLDLLAVLDPFLDRTAELADIVLPVTQWAEEDGTLTNLEGRVIRRRRVVDPPDGVRSDIDVLCDLGRRLGEPGSFRFDGPEQVFEELRQATAGAAADYSGITWDRLDQTGGLHWPCPSVEHPGTPRLFEDRFAHPDGRAHMIRVEHRGPAEQPSDDYPIWFTTGRYREHYNSGAQTRRVRRLRDASREPRLQAHPLLAARLRLVDGEAVRVETRRGSAVFRLSVSTEVRPDTVFAPFHWAGTGAANLLTNPALDPVSRMPEFKVCAARLARADEPVEAAS